MASEATTVDAGGRDLRVSNPDRVIFPATERSGEVTKLDVVEYYLAVGDGILRALARRPTTLERWPKGVHPGIVISTRERGGGDAFYQKRIPQGAPEYVQTARIKFPSGRTADEICPTELAVVGWAAQLGTITFHPWPVRRDDVDHPDELRIDLDPQPGTDFDDAVARRRARRGTCSTSSADTGFPKTSGGRGVHVYVRIEPPLDLHRRAPRGDRVRARARAAPARPGHDQVVEGGARRAGLRRLQPERPRPHDRLGLQRAAQAARAGLGPGGLGRAARRRRRATSRSRPCRRGSPSSATCTRASTSRRTTSVRCWSGTSATTRRGPGGHAVSAGLPEDARGAQAGAAVAGPRPPAPLNRSGDRRGVAAPIHGCGCGRARMRAGDPADTLGTGRHEPRKEVDERWATTSSSSSAWASGRVRLGLVRRPVALDRAWGGVRRLPLVVKPFVWIAFLPWLSGLAIWESDWRTPHARHVAVALVAIAFIVVWLVLTIGAGEGA